MAALDPTTSQVAALIEAERFDEIESLWMERLEAGAADAEFFLATAKQLRRNGERERSATLLALAEESLTGRDQAGARLEVLREISRLASGAEAGLIEKLVGAAEAAYAKCPSLAALTRHAKLRESPSPAEALERLAKIERWLKYDVGEIVFMAGRGAGRVTETNLGLELLRLVFPSGKVSVPIGQAAKVLTPLASDHYLRRKLEDPASLRHLAQADPAALLREMLTSFARPVVAAEIKEAVSGIIAEDRWTAFWTAARKHPQLAVNGTGVKAGYTWSASSAAADASLAAEFDAAPPRRKLEMARKNARARATLGQHLERELARAALENAAADPGLAYELAAASGGTALGERLVATIPAAKLLGGIGDRGLRERALGQMREAHPGSWPEIFSEAFRAEEDSRSLAFIFGELDREAPGERDKLLEEIFRAPRRHPRQLLWCCKEAQSSAASPALAARAGYGTLIRLLDCLDYEEFAPFRPKLKELFDKGGLAVDIIRSGTTAPATREGPREFLAALDRKANLEEYRREMLRGALLMAHPELRGEPEAAPIYTTVAARDRKKQELDQLRLVEIPANRKAIETAREMGDLRENFEYKAARERHEYLNARVAALTEELRRARNLDPGAADATEVRAGTRVTLAAEGGEPRQVTILGPWDADPERGVYSYASEIALGLMGRKPGEQTTIDGRVYSITAIEAWT